MIQETDIMMFHEINAEDFDRSQPYATFGYLAQRYTIVEATVGTIVKFPKALIENNNFFSPRLRS